MLASIVTITTDVRTAGNYAEIRLAVQSRFDKHIIFVCCLNTAPLYTVTHPRGHHAHLLMHTVKVNGFSHAA